jgi:hypothetical protein
VKKVSKNKYVVKPDRTESERPQNGFLSQAVERLRIAEEDLWIRYQGGDLSIVGDWISVITQLRIARNQADKRKEIE